MLRAFALRTLAPRLLPARGGPAGAAAFHSATKNSLAQMLEVERFFQLLDTDKDGSVSKEEAVRYYMATGMPEEEALAIFRAADANNDGKLSVQEVATLLTGKNAPEQGGAGDAQHSASGAGAAA